MSLVCMLLLDLCSAIINNGKEIESGEEIFDGVRVVKRSFEFDNSLWIITTTNGCLTQITTITTSAVRDYLNK